MIVICGLEVESSKIEATEVQMKAVQPNTYRWRLNN
jgi:hypothetical protein